MIIGLTGGIGSGKSTVAGFFRELGIPVYNSDLEAKKLMQQSTSLKKAIIDLLGTAAYTDQGLNRPYIAGLVFKDKALLTQLNQIVHPAVREHFLAWVAAQKSNYVIQESALIFENDSAALYDATILVSAPEEIRIQRVLQRDQISKEQLLARIKNQLPEATKRAVANHIIENIDLDQTKAKVLRLHKELNHKALR